MKSPEPVTLAGSTIRLEPLGPQHAGDLAAAMADPTGFTVSGPAVGPGGLPAWMEDADRESRAGTRIPFAVIELASGRAVGSTSLLDIAPADGRIEIGHTWYGAAWQGTKVNPEAKYLLARYVFEELGATRLQLKTDARNARSRRAMAGIGATFEGILRKHSRRQDGPGIRDVAMFSITDEEWPGVREQLLARLA